MTKSAPHHPAQKREERQTPEHLLPLNYHGTETRAVVYGRICPICAGPLYVPKRGLPPKTCSAKCRKALSRKRKE